MNLSSQIRISKLKRSTFKNLIIWIFYKVKNILKKYKIMIREIFRTNIMEKAIFSIRIQFYERMSVLVRYKGL